MAKKTTVVMNSNDKDCDRCKTQIQAGHTATYKGDSKWEHKKGKCPNEDGEREKW